MARLLLFPPPAMELPPIDDPETNPEWVLRTKSRMPRHLTPADPNWFLSQGGKPWTRWYEAERTMREQRAQGNCMKMVFAFDKIRRDIGLARAAWQPQNWTTMVLGRPVQAE